MNEDQLRERMDRVLATLRSRRALQDNVCPSCKTDDWKVDFIAIASTALPKWPAEAGALGSKLAPNLQANFQSGSYIPTVTFVCNNCGYMKMFNLNILGLWGDGR
jgi:hypothetical protein